MKEKRFCKPRMQSNSLLVSRNHCQREPPGPRAFRVPEVEIALRVCYIRRATFDLEAQATSGGIMNGKWKLASILMVTVFAIPSFGQAAAQAPQDKTVVVLGQTLHYWDVGSGPLIVLVHGLGSKKENDWGRAVGPLSQKYHVIALDQLGFGQSDKPLIDYSIQTYVDFLNEFLHELKIEKATLVGESLGGWISALYTLEASTDKHMVPVERLVLVDAAGLKQDKPIPDLNPSTLAAQRKVLQVVFYDSSWVTDDLVKNDLADRIRSNISYTVHSILSSPALVSERLDGKLDGIHVPTLVVWGRQDELLPIASGERYSKEIAGAKFVSFDKCGHVPPVEKTGEFVAAVEDFVK
jgi:pimeloyl-ACP methyl ester carboxylesterase